VPARLGPDRRLGSTSAAGATRARTGTAEWGQTTGSGVCSRRSGDSGQVDGAHTGPRPTTT